MAARRTTANGAERISEGCAAYWSKVAGFIRGNDWQRQSGKVTLPPNNGIERMPAITLGTCLGGQHGHLATILADRSANCAQIRRHPCCAAVLIPLHHPGQR